MSTGKYLGWVLGLAVLTASMVFSVSASAATLTATSPCLNVATIDVTEFGAAGDGVTDNYPPFVAAIAYTSRCVIYTLHVPAGNYVFYRQWRVPRCRQ